MDDVRKADDALQATGSPSSGELQAAAPVSEVTASADTADLARPETLEDLPVPGDFSAAFEDQIRTPRRTEDLYYSQPADDAISLSRRPSRSTLESYFEPQLLKPDVSPPSSSNQSVNTSPLSSAAASPASVPAPPGLQQSSAVLSTARRPSSAVVERPSLLDGPPHLSSTSTATVTGETAPSTLISPSYGDIIPSHSRHDHPIYPNQAFSVLQSHVYPPPYQPRPLRTRSSHPSQNTSYSQSTSFPQNSLYSHISSSHSGTTVPASRGRSADFAHMDMSSKTAGNTPASSPGLFSPSSHTPTSAHSSENSMTNSPFLHWTHQMQPKETHVADVDRDPISGRKLLNQYEIIDELGRGMHGKVKLGRNLDKGVEVAIKIVARYSKRRRLGKLGNPEDKVKKEVAILKKAIHPNVVALLEVIDDPAIMKVYIVLEYVELGEIVWRTKGDEDIVLLERRRVEREARAQANGSLSFEDERMLREAERKRDERDGRRARLHRMQPSNADFWSLEHGGEPDDETATESEGLTRRTTQDSAASPHSLGPVESKRSSGSVAVNSTSHSSLQRLGEEAEQSVGATSSRPSNSSLPMLNDSSRTNSGHERLDLRSPSMAGSLISHLSSEIMYDPYEEDYSYVPCLTFEQSRQAFRDTVLGLEYLHYQGIIHRDIKPANLLWTAEHRVKISDFGVSYLGRPIRDDDNAEDLSESDAQPLDEAVELAKTVGTPAFYAPELCYTDFNLPRPPVTGQIDLWALGVTLYCLLFARLPFLGEDEFSLFKSIAEDEVFIPSKRLKAVDKDTSDRSPTNQPAARAASSDHRLKNQLIYEDIDEDTRDLLKRILEKDPTKRITLREVKRHPFTLYGIADPVRWIEETDPSRQNEGRKIEVSNEDVEKAVVSLGFLERVRSGMRKMGAAIGFGKGREGRRRARSNVNTMDSASNKSSSPSPVWGEGRRSSLRGDEYFFTPSKSAREGEHPLAQSVTASPEIKEHAPFFEETAPDSRPVSAGSPIRTPVNEDVMGVAWPGAPKRTPSASAASTRTITARGFIDPSASTPPLLSPSLASPTIRPGSPARAMGTGTPGGSSHRHTKSMSSQPPVSLHPARLMQPADQSTPHADATHADASVAVSNALALGWVDNTPTPSDDASSSTGVQVSAQSLRSPLVLSAHLSGTPEAQTPPASTISVDPSVASPSEGTGARYPYGVHDLRQQPYESTAASIARARDDQTRRRRLEIEIAKDATSSVTNSPGGTCPSSPDDHVTHRGQAQGINTGAFHTLQNPTPNIVTQVEQPMISSSSEDQMTSGISQSTSYPSVPSVISAGSSVCTDDPGAYMAKADANRPRGNSKAAATPTIAPKQPDTVGLSQVTSDDEAGYNGDHTVDSDENDDDDDSDEEFLTMGKSKSKARTPLQKRGSGRLAKRPTGRRSQRRDSSSTHRSTTRSVRSARSGSDGTVKRSASNEGPEECDSKGAGVMMDG